MDSVLKKKTIIGTFWSAIDRFSVQGINFILSLIIARLLEPSDYGIIAMISLFLTLSNTFVDSGFANALIRKNDRTETDNSTVFYFNIVIGIIVYAFVLQYPKLKDDPKVGKSLYGYRWKGKDFVS